MSFPSGSFLCQNEFYKRQHALNDECLAQLGEGAMAREKKVWMLAGDVFIQLPKEKARQIVVEENKKIDDILKSNTNGSSQRQEQ